MSYFERQKEELQGTVVLRERGPSLGTKFRLASDMQFVVQLDQMNPSKPRAHRDADRERLLCTPRTYYAPACSGRGSAGGVSALAAALLYSLFLNMQPLPPARDVAG